jgi:hypothetical protein
VTKRASPLSGIDIPPHVRRGKPKTGLKSKERKESLLTGPFFLAVRLLAYLGTRDSFQKTARSKPRRYKEEKGLAEEQNLALRCSEIVSRSPYHPLSSWRWANLACLSRTYCPDPALG